MTSTWMQWLGSQYASISANWYTDIFAYSCMKIIVYYLKYSLNEGSRNYSINVSFIGYIENLDWQTFASSFLSPFQLQHPGYSYDVFRCDIRLSASYFSETGFGVSVYWLYSILYFEITRKISNGVNRKSRWN